MTECQNTRGAWGTKCRACGQVMRAGKPIRSWMAERHAPDPRALAGAIALRDNGRVQRFRLHRTDRRVA